MKITVITLNYNGAENATKLLDSLKEQTDKDFSIIVADNASGDVQQLRDYINGTNIKLIENGSNLGFAAGNNPAIQFAFSNGTTPADGGINWVVLLNPDTWVETDFIERLKENLSIKRGLVGLPIKEGEAIAYGGDIAWLKEPSEMQHLYGKFGQSSKQKRYATGGALAISRDAWEKLGPMNERYFLYFEDMDYSFRAHKRGVAVSYAQEPFVHHAVSQSTKKLGSALLLRYHYRNALYFNFKNGKALTKIASIFWGLYIIGKQIIKLMIGKDPKESEAIIAGVVDFYQNKMSRIDTSKIKVGIECENLEDGQSRWGVGRMTMNLLKEYLKDPTLKEKYELTLYFKNRVPSDEIFKNLAFKIRMAKVPFFNIFYHIVMPLQAMWDRLDWMFFPSYMLPPIYIGKSVVMLTGDVYHEYKSGNLHWRYRLAYFLFTNWAAEFATKILAISESSKEEVAMLYGIPSEKIFVSKLGVDILSVTKPNTHGDYMLYVGQMFPRRHAHESLLAFEKIAAQFPELKFILVGKDKYQPNVIKETVKDINHKLGSERVLHYDYIASDEELQSLYAHAKLFVYVSSNEAFGLPPVEAAAYGVPVVVKEASINRELFSDAAFFVRQPKDIQALADTLKEALTDEAKRSVMKEQYKTIIPKLNWRAFTERVFNQFHA